MANWWTYKDKKKAEANNKTSRHPERHQADAKPSVNNENWWKYRSDNSTFYQMQASDRDQLEQQAQMRQYLETVLPYYERYHAARNAVLENRKWDAFSDKIERAIPFMSGDSLAAQERAANIAASRYDRDFPLYQQMMENAVSGRPYNKAYDMAANAHSTAFQKYNAYNNARLQNLHDTDRGAYYAETMDRSEIEAELARLKAGGSTTHISASGAMHGKAGGKIDEPVTQSGDRIAQYERALSILQYRDNTKKYEEIKAAWWSPDNQPELDLTESGAEDLYYSPLKREATELAELGRAAYEKDLANGAHYASSGALHGGYGGKLYSGDEEERNRQLGIDAKAAIKAQVKESALFGPDATHTPAKTYSERGPEEGYLQQWQKDIFYAMYATDPEEAKRWLTLAHEQAENEYLQGVSDETGRNFVTQILGIPLAAGAGLLSGLDPFGETGQALSKFSEAVTHGGAKAWNEASGTANIPLLGEKGLGDLYSLGVSMVQSGALAVGSAAAGRYDATLATVVEFLGTTLLGSSAAASDYRQSLNLGLNREQAMRHATAAGIAEAAFEYISLDKLVNQDVSRGFWKNVFMQGGIEASEELCTTLANRASDALLAYAEGYDTSIQQRVKELVALGLSRRDAEYKAEQEWFAELISDGLGGFVSGGLMTAGNTVVNWNEYQSGREQQRTAGEYARNARQTDALRRYAEDNGLGWYAKEQATRTETAQGKDTTSTTSQGEAPYSQGKGSGGQVARATQENDGTGNLSPTTKQTKKSRGEKRQERQQAREQRKQDWQIGSDVQRVQAHIQEQFSGKSVQEQTALRDQMIEQYGNGIAPAVYEAISVEAAKKAASLKSADEIRAARDQAVSETKDRAMKRAIADGYDQAVFGQAMRSGNTDEAGRYFQQLRNTGEGGMTLEATVKGQDDQSRQIAITGMTEDGKGVKLADGTTVAVSKLRADADTMDAVQRIADLDMGADADAVLQAYIKADKSGVDGYRWLMDYSLAYEQGRTGKLSLEEAVQRSSLDQRTVMDAYTLGQREAHQSTRDAVESLKAMPKKQGITGKTSNIDTSEIEGVTLNESEREQFELANKLFSLIGVDVKWVASAVKNGRFVGANGSYLNGAVTLDVHAGRNFLEQINSGILATTGHELTHFLQQYAPEQYRALKEFLFRQIVQSSADGETRLERLIWEKQRRASSKLSRKAAEDEVVADACQTMLRDSKAIREFAQQDEETAKGVARWLDKWFGKLKQAFSRSAQLTEEARFVDSFAKEVREAFGKLWDEALREAVETHDRVGNIEKPQQQNSDRDTEYLELAKSPEKNKARLQEMVDEAAKRAGYDMDLYHGSKKGGGFTVFKDWQYFTANKAYAERYMERDNPDSLYHVYVKSERMFDTRRPECREIFEQMRTEYGLSELQENGLPDWTDGYDISDFIEENGLDFDGVVLDEGGDLTEDGPVSRGVSYIIRNSEQVKSADPVTYDDAGKVIPLSERFNDAKRDIRFSMREPVETTDRLIAWHNMNEDALRSALELGGLAMPSWAIKTADRAHTSYGKISVIAPRELVDPKLNRSSMIFGGDAWTPVFPDIDYDVSFEAAEDLSDEITGLIGENVMRELGGASIDTQNIAQQLRNSGGSVSNYYKNNVALRYAYLKSIGKDINVPRREVRLDQSGQYDNQAVQMFADRLVNGKKSLQYFRSMTGREVMQQEDLKKAISDVMVARHGEEVRDLYAPDELSFRNVEAMLSAANRFFENGGDVPSETDRYALAKEIDKVIDEAAYEKWIGEKLNKTVTKKGVYNGKDPFTPSGNRRSFDALHYAYNLANIVKAMKSQPKKGRTQFLSGPGSVKGAALKSYNTVEQVRKDRGRLVNSAEEGQAAYDAYNRNLEDILDRMSKNGDRFDAADALIEVFQHAKTETAIYNYMQRELKDWYNISRELAHDAFELIGQINALPMEYFEGKTYDAVRFDETAAVVVPDNIDPALKQQLEDAGARVVEYAAGDDTDRLAKVNSVEGAQFSERDYSLPSDLELMDRAIEGLSEAGGEEYWKALLETDSGLAEDVKGYKDQARKLAAAEKRLADYKKQMQLGGNRKLNTRGITSLSLEMMKTLDASDAKGRGVAKQVTQTLTSAYQKALDAIDKGTSDADAWDIVYNEGVVPAAEIIAKQGTHSEKTGRGWITTSLESYYGEGGMQAIIDTVAGYVGADFATNRYRKAIQPTIADRIVERTEKRMQKQVDAATERATEAERINKKLTEDRDFWKNQQAKDSETVTFLNERLKEARQDLRDNKSLSSQERRKLAARIKSLQTQLQAKREEIRALKSLSQQLDKQAVEFGQKQAKLLDKLEQQVQRERDILSGKLKPLGMQRLLKAEREKAVAKAEQHKDEVFRNYKDRQQQAKLRGRIKNLSDEMKRRMTNPSERAYVPASLYESMTRLADVLDDVLSPNPGSKAEAKYRSMMDAIHGLAREYAAVKDLDDPVYSSEYDQEIQEAISDIERVLERKDADWIAELTGDTKKGLRELSTGELQRIYELMRQINYAMVGATSMLGFTGFKNVFDAMQFVVGQMQNEKSLKSLSKHEKAKRLRMLDNLSVMRAVEMMSGWDRSAALYQLFHAIEQGTDESWAWVMGYNKSLQDLKTGKNEKAYRKALTEALDFGITDEEGLKVTTTKMQAIQILMTAEREAHNDKLLHLQTGGAVIRNAEDIQNGKGAKATSQTVKVTPELLQKIQDSLTDWDRAYIKAVRSYFQKEGRRTNEIMYKLKHRVLQTEEYYVPYSVDKNYLETNLDERQAMSMWVKTPGSTNALQQKAKQPVIIDGMDAVMERHVKEIADYIGLALPIRDFSKVYNGMLKTGGDNPLPVKETIDRAFGSKGQHLLTQAVIDVQGGSAKQNWSSGISDFLSGLQSAFVRSALLINPSVTIKQAASYIAAESILSHRALVAGNRATFSSDKTKSPALIAYLFANPEGKTAHRIYNEIDRYTSLHYQRRLGMSQAEIANEANRTGKLKRKMNMIGANMEQSKIGHAVRKTGESLNPVTWIQRMDVATTATLWVACKEQAKLDGMKAGTAEFWQRTTELYERCLRETQPMYDGLHRTAHQKQAGGLVQFLFPFRTVPIQNHGQLAASYETLKASKNKSKAEQAEAKRFFAKTVWAQTESAFIFSMMTFIAAALKRKTKKYRDEDEEFTAESFAKGLMTDVGSTLFSVLVPMYGSELVNIGSRALDKFQGNSGYTYDAFSVGVVDMLNDLASSFDKIAADFGKIARGEDVSFGDVGSHGLAMLLKAAKLAGIPADTVRTYFNGIVGNVEDIANGRIPALNDESWERATGVNAKRFYEAWEAGDEAKMQTVLNEVRQSGKSEDSIANAFNSYAKDAYENNGLSLEQYADYLDKTGMFDAEKISGKVKNLVRDEFQAGERSEDEAISALTGICGMDEDAAWKTVQRWEAGAEHEGEEDYSYSQYEDLREALDEGKSLKEAGADYLAHGYTEKQITDAAVDHLKDRYLAGEISEDEAVKTWAEYKGKDENEAWMAVQRWESAAAHADEEDYSFSQYDAIDEAIAANKDIKALVKELTDHGVEEKNITSHVKSYLVDRYVAGGVTETALKNQLSRYLGIVAKDDVDKILNDANSKKQYGVNYSSLDEEYRAGNIKASEMKNALMKYGGLSAADAEKKIRWYDLQKANPSLEISESKANAWYDGTSYTKTNGHESAKTAGMSIQDYLRAKDELAKVKGVDANNDGRTDTGSREIAYIRTLTAMSWLTDRQRRALYYEEYKGTSKTSGRPW